MKSSATLMVFIALVGCNSSDDATKRTASYSVDSAPDESPRTEEIPDPTAPLSTEEIKAQGEALAAIANLRARYRFDENISGRPLITLDLMLSGVTDAHFEHLKGLPRLQTLYLGEANVTDKTLQLLKGIKTLQRIDLSGTKITDEGVAHLRELTNLQHLNLRSTQITDRSLEHINRLLNLKSLHLQKTSVTQKGVNKLQAALPNCRIYRP